MTYGKREAVSVQRIRSAKSANLFNMVGYTEKPCVYVRWVDELQSCYIGRTANLYLRYNITHLKEIFYIEEFSTIKEAGDREKELIREFVELGVSIANKWVAGGKYEYGDRYKGRYKDKYKDRYTGRYKHINR